MADEPLSKSLQPKVRGAQLANLKAQRVAVENRIALKKEIGEDTAADEAELTLLTESISLIEATGAQP